MNKVALCFALAGFLLTVLTASAIAQEFWDKPADLLQSGDFAGAYAEAEQLLVEHPDDPVLLRIQGVALLSAGYADESVQLLVYALSRHPDRVSFRYYLAQAYAAAGYLAEALAEVDAVIAEAPSSDYARHCREVRPELSSLTVTEQALPAAKRIDVYLRGGYEFDNNVAARSSADEAIAGKAETWRWVASAYAEWRALDQMADGLPFTLAPAYSYYRTGHQEDEFSGYDVASHTPSLSLSRNGYLGQRYYRLRLAGDYSMTELDGEDYSEVAGAQASAGLHWADFSMLQISGRYQWNEYENDTDFPEYYSRDGEEWTAGVDLYFYLLNNRVVLGLGYDYRVAETDGLLFELESSDYNANVSISLPAEFRVYASYAYREQDYTKFSPDPRRIDDVGTVYASLSRPLVKDRLMLELNYTRVVSDSTLDFAEYEQEVYGAAVSLTY